MEGQILVWAPKHNVVEALADLNATVTCIVFSHGPQPRYLAAADTDGKLTFFTVPIIISLHCIEEDSILMALADLFREIQRVAAALQTAMSRRSLCKRIFNRCAFFNKITCSLLSCDES